MWGNICTNLKLIRHCSKVKCFAQGYCNVASQLFKDISQDEEAEILGTLQKCAEENVVRYNLNEKRLKNIQQYLKANEKFTSLDQLLEVGGIGLTTLNKICRSILEKVESDEESKVKSVPRLLIPPLSKDKIQTISSVVGLNIGFNAISWAKFNRENKEFQHWNVLDTSDSIEKKCDLHNIYEIAHELCSSIPKADIYLMENTNWSNLTNSKVSVAFNVRRALLTATIMSLLNTRRKQDFEGKELENQVHFFKTFVPARLFQTLIGAEKVSAQNVVEDIYNQKPDVRHSGVFIPPELYDSYSLLEGYLKENMCQSVLLVMAFTELVLYDNTNAMLILLERSYKKKKLLST